MAATLASIALTVTAIAFVAPAVRADALNCSLAEYKASAGLTAAVADNTLALTWDGEKHEEVRLRLTINGGTPTIRDVAVRRKGAQWATLASNVTPDFRVVSGFRRATDQQIRPLRDLGVAITPEVIDRIKWEAFWDSPLNVPGDAVAHGGATPPVDGIANQPGLPRKPEEITRASAVYQAQGCTVKTNGARLEVSFPGVQLGVFSGRLELTVYKGTNLIRQAIVAKTDERSVAYKYEAGLKGLAIEPKSQVVWRSNNSNLWVDYQFGGARNDGPVTLKTANRLLAAEGPSGSIAAFPPPHSFFWARETEFNLGYNWYRKDSDTSFAFGVRQADGEEDAAWQGHGPEDRRQNFALYSARPGTWQRMPVFFYVTGEPGQAAIQSALAYTRDDHYKPLAGYQVMATHFHTGMVRRLNQLGGLDATIPDFDLMKGAGINIFAPIDGGGGGGAGAGNLATAGRGGAAAGGRGAGAPAAAAPGGGGRGDRLKNLADYYEAARRHSDRNFLILPDEENTAGSLGGHTDFVVSHPVFWTTARAEGQPFVEQHPTYGKVYHVGSREDAMEMAKLENMLVYMPHPRSKGSTGYPDAVKDKAHFIHENYRGIGFRWGMGLDGSETRLCEYRCLALLDDMNNWVADLPTPPKYAWAISETYQKGPGDDIYANNPVNYVKLDRLPTSSDWSPIVNALKRGDYFWTSGEVLISQYAVEGTGNQRTVSADVEWTFPLDFVEVVWGDGQKTDRQIISATDLPPFGRHRFQIPFNAAAKKWVRFAVWDSAGNGAFVQPIKLTAVTSTAQAR
jgi:hypothetical protein